MIVVLQNMMAAMGHDGPLLWLFKCSKTKLKKKIIFKKKICMVFKKSFFKKKVICLKQIFVSLFKKFNYVKKNSFCKKIHSVKQTHFVKHDFFFQFNFATNEQI